MMSDPKKLETEQIEGILNWDKEHIECYLVRLYGHTKKDIRSFQSACRKELKLRQIKEIPMFKGTLDQLNSL